MKKIHNIFAYYGESKPKEVKCQKKLHFFHSYDVMLDRFVPKMCMSHHIKRCKYIQEIIEMIFNIYEICSIY
jgi:hypothetical protein